MIAPIVTLGFAAGGTATIPTLGFPTGTPAPAASWIFASPVFDTPATTIHPTRPS